jgi:hypothetical protein
MRIRHDDRSCGCRRENRPTVGSIVPNAPSNPGKAGGLIPRFGMGVNLRPCTLEIPAGNQKDYHEQMRRSRLGVRAWWGDVAPRPSMRRLGFQGERRRIKSAGYRTVRAPCKNQSARALAHSKASRRRGTRNRQETPCLARCSLLVKLRERPAGNSILPIHAYRSNWWPIIHL